MLTVPLLKAFIVAHDDELVRLNDIPKKGTVKEAIENGEVNAISMAHKCRMKPNLLEGKPPHSDEDIAQFASGGDNDGDLTVLYVTTVRLGEPEQVLPSELLRCPLWRANIIRLFELQKRNDAMRVDPGLEVSEATKVAADQLLILLRSRFKVLLKRRIQQASWRNHWSMRFAYRNLPVVAAVLVLSGHIKSDLGCLNEQDSLLTTDSNCYIKCADCPNNEGAYLYFDTVRCVFVRSGKVGGRGFVERGNDHVKGSKENRPSSGFYRLYPSKESSRSNNKRRGYFESLIQFVAAGFDPKSEHVENIDKDYKNGGVFILSKDEERLIRSSMKNLKCSAKVKFSHMLAYLMEFGYDLTLAPGDVVSANPGFESVLGVF